MREQYLYVYNSANHITSIVCTRVVIESSESEIPLESRNLSNY